MAILVACICIINIILWVIFLVRFKKLFSTDKIINTTTEKMNKLVMEIDKATERNIFLTDASEKKIQKLLDEADKNMELFKEANKRLRDMISEAEKVSKRSEIRSPIYEPVREVIREEIRPQPKTERVVKKNIDAYLQNSRKVIDSESTFKVVDSVQQDLFDENKTDITDTVTTITEDGAAYKEVPLIITRVYDEKPVPKENKKKNLTKAVQELYNNGLTVQQIANELSCSITEVQLIIDMCE
jgi:hypothetical protein